MQAAKTSAQPNLVGVAAGLLHVRMPKSDNPSDLDQADCFADLVEAVAERRDSKAFARLFAHYGPRIKSYFRRLGVDSATAEELMQDVMTTLWSRAGLYDRKRATVGTWLFTIARNRRVDALRRERRPEVDACDLQLDNLGDDIEFHIAQAQAAARLRQALARLPAEQAELVRRSFFEDLSHGAIADDLKLPLGTIKSRLRRALAKLRSAIGEDQ